MDKLAIATKAAIERQTESLKRRAKKLKKEKGITHAQALDEIAKEHGHANWGQFYRSKARKAEFPNAKGL